MAWLSSALRSSRNIQFLLNSLSLSLPIARVKSDSLIALKSEAVMHLSSSIDVESNTSTPEVTDQSSRLSRSKIITIFLACASVDLVALMDQTTLAASLSIVSSALNAGTKSSWIAGAYFM